MLTKWGIEQADKAHLPTYLEASMLGRPLYERMGFRPEFEYEFDLAKYGGEGVEVTTIMIRPPPSA
jgi:hypothetical protein